MKHRLNKRKSLQQWLYLSRDQVNVFLSVFLLVNIQLLFKILTAIGKWTIFYLFL